MTTTTVTSAAFVVRHDFGPRVNVVLDFRVLILPDC